MNFYQQYVDQSRYARWIPELQRRETWEETVERCVLFLKEHIECNYDSSYHHIPWKEIKEAILNLEVMPSMRLVMTAGKAAARDNIAIYNCAYLPIDDIRAFDETMYILMCGTGVGFSVERQLIGKLPEIADEFHESETIIAVRDSRIGWSGALRELISLLYAGAVPKWDLSKLRPAGARLHTFGGRASGPEPLNQLFEHIVRIFKAAAGRRLNSVECHDIVCHIADAVIVGGVRRSALISLSNLSDNRMRDAKTNNWWEYNGQRQLANNSVAYTEKPDNGTFLREWATLYESKSGERGLFNRKGAIKKIKQGGIRNPNHEFGTNPCLAGSTIIATVNGNRTFEELAFIGEDVLVYSWHPKSKLPVVRMMRNPHKTGVQVDVIEVGFDSGLKVKCTLNHGFYTFRGVKIQAKDLKIGQSIRAFSMSEDGSKHLRVHAWDAEKNSSCHQWVARMVYENAYGKLTENEIVHHKDKDTYNNSLENLEKLTKKEHNVLHYPQRFNNGFDGKCKNHKVISISHAGKEDVYNGCVDDSHTYIIVDPTPISGIMSGIVSANCGEIVLRPNGLCNLSEVIIRPTDTVEDVKRKVRLATILGTIQCTFTDFRYLRSVWKKNADEERLLGVSLTGIMDHPYFNGIDIYTSSLEESLRELKDYARTTNLEFSSLLGIQPSAAITCIKPSGTVSQLVDSSSGIHPRYSKFYIRTVRGDNKDVVTQFLKDKGFPWEPDVSHPDTMTVFSFPMKSPEAAVTRNDRSALEQLELYKVYADNWCEHNVSVSIYVKESEWIDVLAWVYKNWDSCNGLSFFPADDHIYKQAPYQEITEEQYNEMLHFMPKEVNFIDMVESEDTGTGYHELACKAGICEI